MIRRVGMVVGVIGVIAAVVAQCELDLAPRYLQRGGYVTSDFFQYCEGIAAFRDGLTIYSRHRSWFVSGMLAPLAARWGVVDALLLGAIGGLAAVVGGVALHAGAVRGWLAAFAAALAVMTLAPLTLVGRTLSYYPQMAGSFALAAGGAAWALRSGRLLPVVLGGALACVPALTDARGVLWTLPCVAVVGLGALVGPVGEARRVVPTLLRVAVLAAVVAASWRIGAWVWPADLNGGVVAQMMTQVAEVARFGGQAIGEVRARTSACQGEDLVWGRSPISEVPRAIECLFQLGAVQRGLIGEAEAAGQWTRDVEPTLRLGLAAVVIAALRNLRDPRRLLSLLLPLLPAAAALSGARSEPELRRLELGFLWIPVAYGAAAEAMYAPAAWALRQLLSRLAVLPARRRIAEIGLVFVAAGVILAVSTGVLRTQLNPYAYGRANFAGQLRPWMERTPPDNRSAAACAAALQGDGEAGRSPSLVLALEAKAPPLRR